MRPWMFVLAALAGCGDKGDDSAGGDGGGGDLVGNATDGAAVFASTCAQSNCHGPDGSGSDPSSDAADLAKEVPTLTDAELESIITEGYVLMAPVDLEPQELADVIAYLRQEFGG
jgi:mono/diheme cytochrome c family protein